MITQRRNKLIKRLLTAVAVAVVAVPLTGRWWTAHRPEYLHEAISPRYWWRRWRAEDLWDTRERMLLHGNRAYREVALTIDDGPHGVNAQRLLGVLEAHRVHATFFVVGQRMKERPDLVRRMLADGDEVGNHTQDHLRLDTLDATHRRAEIDNCDINFHRITGGHFTLLRPPGMRYNQAVIQTAEREGYVTVGWTCAAHDYEDESADFIVRSVRHRLENGSIILLHDERAATIDAMPRLIESLQRDGYHLVTVSEMLAHLPHPVVPAARTATTAASSGYHKRTT